MSTPHDFIYWAFYVFWTVLLVGIPLLVIAGLTGFLARMWPVMLSIWGLALHIHRHVR